MTVQELIQALFKQVEEGNGHASIMLMTREGDYCTMAGHDIRIYLNAGGQVSVTAGLDGSPKTSATRETQEPDRTK